MSARFGRNQRRRAREALASAATETQRYKQAHGISAELAHDLGDRLQRVRSEVAEAKDMLPLFTALLSAETLKVNYPPAERVYVPVMEPIEITYDLQPTVTSAMVREVPLYVMLAGLTEHQRYGISALRAHVLFKGREAACFAVSEDALRIMTRQQLVRELARNLAEQLAEQLKGPRR